MQYEALVAGASQYLHRTKDIENALDLAESMIATSADVHDAALSALTHMTAASEELDEARLLLARELHQRGISFRVLAEALGTSAMTARRRITELDES